MVDIYLCDDVPELRQLLRIILEEDPGLRVVGETGDAQIGIEEIAELQPNVVLLDLSMPGMDGLEALPLIRRAAPDDVRDRLFRLHRGENGRPRARAGCRSLHREGRVAGARQGDGA